MDSAFDQYEKKYVITAMCIICVTIVGLILFLALCCCCKPEGKNSLGSVKPTDLEVADI